MNVVVVSHALVERSSWSRWVALSELYNVTVTVLVPRIWHSRWHGSLRTWRIDAHKEGRFEVVPLPAFRTGNGSRYVFRSVDASLRRLAPDIICVMQDEHSFALQQMALYRRLWAQRAKLVFFSWNNINVPLGSWRARLLWRSVIRSVDAAIAGSQEVVSVLRRAGYSGVVDVQTEIGIDEFRYCPGPELLVRGDSRGTFVVGYAGRLIPAKGVMDLAHAVLGMGGKWQMVCAGGGECREPLEELFAERGMADRLQLLGEIEQGEMPEFFRSIDVLVLPSRTTPTWKEQFGLVLAQAMACGTPVVGSSSGAIPEVIGDAGLVFPEGDIEALRDVLQILEEDREVRVELAKAGISRARAQFGSAALARQAFELFNDLLQTTAPQSSRTADCR
jgi:L-malate glycosyltransferase